MFLRSLSSLRQSPLHSSLIQLRHISTIVKLHNPELSKNYKAVLKEVREHTPKPTPEIGPDGITDVERKAYQNEFFEIVKKYAPATFPQICQNVLVSDTLFSNKSNQWIKHSLLRPLVKSKRILKLRNPIAGCNNYLFHVGKKLEPENPDLCPNTDALNGIISNQKVSKKLKEIE